MHPERMAPSALVFFMDQISKPKIVAEGEVVLVGEFRHILHGLTPSLPLRSRHFVLGQRFERSGHHFLGRIRAASPELLLDQTLTLRIETNVHRTPLYGRDLTGTNRERTELSG